MLWRIAREADREPVRVSWTDDVAFPSSGTTLSHRTLPQLLQQGIDAVHASQGPVALAALQQASHLQPDSRDVRHWLGQAQRLCGQAEAAEETFRSLLDANPLDVETALALAFLLREQGRVDELSKLLLRFAQQTSVATQSLLQLVGVLRDSNQYEGAIEVMRRVLSRESEPAIHHLRLARLYQGTGQHEAALHAYRDTLLRDPSLGGAWLGLANLQRFTAADQPDWQLLGSAPSFATNPEAAMCLAFARGKGFDDLQQYEQAWNQYCAGNRLREQSQPWDPASWQNQQQQLLSAPVQSLVETAPSRRPIYIVGMLRSGTTLLEQLLDQHPRITARGELNFLAHAWKLWRQNPGSAVKAEELATQVWTHMRQGGPEDHFYIDKNPLNFRFVPLLASSMPEARILHLQRDGRDSCLSCFMQLFQHPDSAFANRLEHLVQFYHGYLQLMQRCERLLHGQIYKLSYESLIKDNHGTLAGVLEFLQLPAMDPDLGLAPVATAKQRPIRTASSWQARQGIHRRSLGRWQHYYEFAPEFFDRIAELDQQYWATQSPIG
jgi:tetratricopeptide (TPR) repeat protein